MILFDEVVEKINSLFRVFSCSTKELEVVDALHIKLKGELDNGGLERYQKLEEENMDGLGLS